MQQISVSAPAEVQFVPGSNLNRSSDIRSAYTTLNASIAASEVTRLLYGSRSAGGVTFVTVGFIIDESVGSSPG